MLGSRCPFGVRGTAQSFGSDHENTKERERDREQKNILFPLDFFFSFQMQRNVLYTKGGEPKETVFEHKPQIWRLSISAFSTVMPLEDEEETGKKNVAFSSSPSPIISCC